MSKTFSERLERAIGEYIRASVEFVLHAGSAEAVNTTGDAVRALIYTDRDMFINALKRLREAYIKRHGCYPLPDSVGHAEMCEADAAISKATGLE